MSEPQPITHEELKKRQQFLGGLAMGDYLLQHAGIETVSSEGLATSDSVLAHIAPDEYYWLSDKDIREAQLPKLEIASPEVLETLPGLIEASTQITERIKQFVKAGGTDRQALFRFLEQQVFSEVSMAESLLLSYTKVRTLLTIPGLEPNLQSQLQEIEQFFKEEIIPAIDSTTPEYSVAKNRVATYLAQPKAHRQETYAQKAERVLVRRQQFESEHVYKRESQSTFTTFAQAEALHTSIAVQESVMALAATVNHLRLLEKLTKEGLNIPELHTKIKNLVEQLPKDLPSFKDLKKEVVWRQLATSIAEVTNTIARLFPHDTVYLLGQALKYQQANCAGKSMMAVQVLRDLGLDAVVSSVMITADSPIEGAHVDVAVRFARGLRLQLDLNYKKEVDSIPDFNHAAYWLRPSGQIVTEPEEVKKLLAQYPENPLQLLRTARGFEVFEYQEKKRSLARSFKYAFLGLPAVHRLVTENTDPTIVVDYFNLGLHTKSSWSKTAAYSPSQRMVAAEWYFRRAVDNLPHDSSVYSELANLLSENKDYFNAEKGGKFAIIKSILSLHRRAINKNPQAYNSFANLGASLIYNRNVIEQFSQTPQPKIANIALELLDQAFTINPNSEFINHNWAHALYLSLPIITQDTAKKRQLIEEAVIKATRAIKLKRERQASAQSIAESESLLASLKAQEQQLLH